MDQSDLHTVSRIQYSKHTLGMPQPWWQYSASESNSTFHIGEYAKMSALFRPDRTEKSHTVWPLAYYSKRAVTLQDSNGLNGREVFSLVSQAASAMHFRCYFSIKAINNDHCVSEGHSAPLLKVNSWIHFLIHFIIHYMAHSDPYFITIC